MGGDDFVAMTTPDRVEDVARTVIEAFDRAATELLDPEDVERGYLKICKRSGEVMKIKSIGITLAVVTNESGPIGHIRRVADIEVHEVSEELAHHDHPDET